MATKPSGPAWCALYPCSVSLDDLLPEFGAKVRAMVDSLLAGGANVLISTTYRPAERAYLMHWACMIANGQDPTEVPHLFGVDIDWAHGGNLKSAKSAAAAMVAVYKIAFPAALVSRHTQRRAVDMSIAIRKSPDVVPKFKGGDGKTWVVGAGDLPALYKFGKSFGVIKLEKDAPHWSDDGH